MLFDMVFNEKFSLLTGVTVDFIDAELSHPVLGKDGKFDDPSLKGIRDNFFTN